jgi:hypothetical protein
MVAWRGLSALQLLESIVPYPWRSSLIHLRGAIAPAAREPSASGGNFLSKEFG